MKAPTKNIKTDVPQNITKKLDSLNLDKIAEAAGFKKRASNKTRPKGVILGFIIMVTTNCSKSVESWAKHISLISGETISKQGLWKRIKEPLVEFLKQVLENILKGKIGGEGNSKEWKKGDIYLQDSTEIGLNEKLNAVYPGKKKSKRSKNKARFKIQVIYNATREIFSNIEITGYRENDQSKSRGILEIVKAGDLIIRDLGYFTTEVFKEMIEGCIYFISRLRSNVNVYDQNGSKIHLYRKIKGKELVDIQVLVGEKEKVPVRLVAKRLNDKKYRERRAEAKADRDKRNNHSEEYLKMLRWEIFITNIGREILAIDKVIKLYGVRWRIETIFKCWKSYFKIADVPTQANKARIDSYIYCMLIYITLFQMSYYQYYEKLIAEEYCENISLMKFSQYASIFMLLAVTEYLKEKTNIDEIFFKSVTYYCKYDKSKKHKNYYDKFKN